MRPARVVGAPGTFLRRENAFWIDFTFELRVKRRSCRAGVGVTPRMYDERADPATELGTSSSVFASHSPDGNYTARANLLRSMSSISRGTSPQDLQLATLRDMNDEPVAQFPAADLMVPPGVALRDHRIQWLAGPDWAGWRLVRPERSLLERFVELAADRSGREIEEFARAWGVLGICRHDLPASHSPPDLRARFRLIPGVSLRRRVGPDARRMCLAGGLSGESGTGSEPLDVWVSLAQEARRLVRLSYRISSWRIGDPPPLLEFSDLGEPSPWGQEDGADEQMQGALQEARETVAANVDAWLRVADIRLRVVTTAAGYRVNHEAAFDSQFAWMLRSEDSRGLPGWRGVQTLAVGNLFRTLTMQLLAATTAILAPYVCAGCAQLVWAKRRPQRGRDSFCDRCRTDKVPRRIASAKWRDRNPDAIAAYRKRAGSRRLKGDLPD